MYEYHTRIMRETLPDEDGLTAESTRGWELVQILPITDEMVKRMGDGLNGAQAGDCIIYFKRRV